MFLLINAYVIDNIEYINFFNENQGKFSYPQYNSPPNIRMIFKKLKNQITLFYFI